MHTQAEETALPFLTRFAVERRPHPAIEGQYCPQRHLWVHETPDGSAPIVATNLGLAGAVTKTLTVQEQDDDHFIGLPELATKTDVQQESDDQISCASLVELVTKTYFELESDDQGGQIL